MATDWLKAAQRTTDSHARTRFLRNHKANQIKTAIASCELCPLSLTRINTVPFDNNRSRPVVLIGEAPGVNEDRQGKPFVGRSGKLLDKMIVTAGEFDDNLALTRDDVVVMNTIACRPPKNRNPYQSEIASCKNHFTAQLDFTGAWIVVILGGQALKACGFGGRISEVRGVPMWRDGRLWIPTYHPAYVLRNDKARKDVVGDIGLALKIAYGGEWWKPMEMSEFSGGELKGLVGFLDTRGWVVVDSKRLEDRVVVVSDGDVNVPRKYGKLIRYTLEELVRIGAVGKGYRVSIADLKGIHLVKGLGGTIVK